MLLFVALVSSYPGTPPKLGADDFAMWLQTAGLPDVPGGVELDRLQRCYETVLASGIVPDPAAWLITSRQVEARMRERTGMTEDEGRECVLHNRGCGALLRRACDLGSSYQFSDGSLGHLVLGSLAAMLLKPDRRRTSSLLGPVATSSAAPAPPAASVLLDITRAVMDFAAHPPQFQNGASTMMPATWSMGGRRRLDLFGQSSTPWLATATARRADDATRDFVEHLPISPDERDAVRRVLDRVRQATSTTSAQIASELPPGLQARLMAASMRDEVDPHLVHEVVALLLRSQLLRTLSRRLSPPPGMREAAVGDVGVDETARRVASVMPTKSPAEVDAVRKMLALHPAGLRAFAFALAWLADHSGV